ncbi:hypothetical protein ACLB2K_024216 [Fragaria x ananassa]
MGIVTIGLADERFQVMALLPCRHSNCPISSSIVMSGNSLLVSHEFSIWMMKEYGVEESWTEVIYIYPEDLPQERERYRNVIWTCEVPCPLYVSYVETLISPQNGICESENNIASTLENKGARMEVLSFNIPAPSGWSKKGRKTKRGRWSHQRRSNSTPCLNIHS